ncbi:MAG: universal stress protein UspE [Pseudomonadota bacterium]
MMNPTKIVTVVSKNDKNNVAIKRAAMIAQRFSAKLMVIMCAYDQSFEMTSIMKDTDRENLRDAIIQEKEKVLGEIIERHVPKEIEYDQQVLWGSREYELIRQYCVEKISDLLVKYVKHESTLSRLFFTPQDWHIIREVPCNILFVQGEGWRPQGNIIAAVSADDDDAHHLRLNNHIINTSLFLSEKFDAQVHVTNVYPYPLVDVPFAYSGIDHEMYCKNMRESHEESTKKLVVEKPIADENLHIIEGLPEEAIPNLAQQINAELVVMGTVARKGLSGAVIGNTAERILDKINCDVLAIKLNEVT